MRKALILLVLCAPRMAPGTSIIAIKKAGSISISTDSKTTSPGGAWGNSCKIYRFRKLYFAIAGLASDAGRGFHPEDIVAAHFTESGSLATAIERVEPALKMSLQNELGRMKAEDERTFVFEVKPGADPLDIVFAEVRGGVPQLAGLALSYSAVGKPPVIARELPCPDHCVLALGHTKNAIEFLKGGGGKDLSSDALSRALVEAGIQGDPTTIGPPVVTLRIDRNGATWVANGSGCPIEVSRTPVGR